MLRSITSLGFVLSSLFGPIAAPGARYSPAAVPVWQGEDCTRGAAEPVVRKKVFPKTTFRLLPDKHSGLETVALPSGDRLLIRHEGCEYYMLTFRFETTRFRQSPTDLELWFRNAAQLLTEAAPGLDAPVNIPAGLRALRAYINGHKQGSTQPVALGEEIGYGTESLPSFVVVEKVEKLAGAKTAVEVSFAVGPL